MLPSLRVRRRPHSGHEERGRRRGGSAAKSETERGRPSTRTQARPRRSIHRNLESGAQRKSPAAEARARQNDAKQTPEGGWGGFSGLVRSADRGTLSRVGGRPPRAQSR